MIQPRPLKKQAPFKNVQPSRRLPIDPSLVFPGIKHGGGGQSSTSER